MKQRKRKLFTELVKHSEYQEFTIIVGARQTGKTTLLNQIEAYLKEKEDNVHFISMEDPDILNLLNKHPENLFKLIRLNDTRKTYVLCDEIQYLENPSNFLKLLYDKYAKQLKIIATGSSAFYINAKFTDSLAGRKRIFTLYTLSFDEYLHFQYKDELIDEWKQLRRDIEYHSLHKQEIETLFLEYLLFGGYPAVSLQNEPKEKVRMLKELYTSFVKKDLYEANIVYEDKFHNLLIILAGQCGELLNMNELSNTLQMSVKTVKHYIHILQKCFHINLVKPYHKNHRKELTKMPKVFFNDLGLRNSLLKQFQLPKLRSDRGQIAENYAYIRLRQLYETDNIRFWRTNKGHEIDFIVLPDLSNNFALEIKYDDSKIKMSKYNVFNKAYPDIPLHFRSLQAKDETHSLLRF